MRAGDDGGLFRDFLVDIGEISYRVSKNLEALGPVFIHTHMWSNALGPFTFGATLFRVAHSA